jgi:hypothetical protein
MLNLILLLAPILLTLILLTLILLTLIFLFVGPSHTFSASSPRRSSSPCYSSSSSLDY